MLFASPTPTHRSSRTLLLVGEAAPSYGSNPRVDDDDSVVTLGEAIMTLSEHLQGETHRLLLLIAEFDRRHGWKLHGFSSWADWLAYSTRLDKVTAREKVRVARALAGLPETSAAMSRGELSFSQVRAITRIADEENELELLAETRSTSAAGLERLVRAWKRVGRKDESTLEDRRHASRFLSVFSDDEGSYLVRGRLDPEVGALLMRAIEAASDALCRGSVPEATPEQRRADALALLVERALSAGLSSTDSEGAEGAEVSSETPSVESPPDCGCAHDATRLPSRVSAEASVSRIAKPWRSDRYMVVLHVDEATLSDGGEPGRSHLEDGTRVSAETARRLALRRGGGARAARPRRTRERSARNDAQRSSAAAPRSRGP